MEVAQRIGQLQKVPVTAKSAQGFSSLLETSNSLRLLGSIFNIKKYSPFLFSGLCAMRRF